MYMLGLALAAIGGLWLVVNAFRSGGVLWGLGSLLVPFVAQIYGLLNFAANKIPLILSIVGIVLVVMGWSDYTSQLAELQAAGEVAP